jgi:hypothetical protein
MSETKDEKRSTPIPTAPPPPSTLPPPSKMKYELCVNDNLFCNMVFTTDDQTSVGENGTICLPASIKYFDGLLTLIDREDLTDGMLLKYHLDQITTIDDQLRKIYQIIIHIYRSTPPNITHRSAVKKITDRLSQDITAF